jgi:hypothetical protein
VSGPHVEELTPLSAQLLAYYRDMVAVHADEPVNDKCAICHVHRCQDWRFARERLMCAGQAVEAQGQSNTLAPSTVDDVA